MSAIIAACTLAAAAIGVALDYAHPNRGAALVLPVFGGGVAYVATRALTIRASPRIRTVKVISAVASLVLWIFMSCGIVSPLDYARAYGWWSPLAFGNTQTILLLLSILAFGVADVVDMTRRVRGWLRSRQGAHHSRVDAG